MSEASNLTKLPQGLREEAERYAIAYKDRNPEVAVTYGLGRTAGIVEGAKWMYERLATIQSEDAPTDDGVCRRCGRSRSSEVHSSSYGQGCLYMPNLAEALADKLFSWCTYGTAEYAKWSDALRTDMEKAAHELKRLGQKPSQQAKDDVAKIRERLVKHGYEQAWGGLLEEILDVFDGK